MYYLTLYLVLTSNMILPFAKNSSAQTFSRVVLRSKRTRLVGKTNSFRPWVDSVLQKNSYMFDKRERTFIKI